MGVIARVVAFARQVTGTAQHARVTINPGAGANQDTTHFSDPGDDSQPLTNDLVACASNLNTNGQSSVGYVDEKNAGLAQPGEKRIYARDSDGNIVASIYLQNDGTIILANNNATILLSAAGNFDFMGGTFSINGQVFADHTHGAGTYASSQPVTGISGDVT